MRMRRVGAALLIGLAWASATAALAVAEVRSTVAVKSPLCHPDDELWLISTRSICGCPSETTTPDFRVSKFDGVSQWQTTDLASLTTALASKRTLLWVHGNRIDGTTAFDTGWEAYRAFVSGQREGVRLVTWSWPSDQIHGQLRDIRAKTGQSHTDGALLGWFLRRVPGEARIDLVGYSLGARLITVGLQDFATGAETTATQKTPSSSKTPRLRSVLLAPAIDNDWLLPGAKQGQVLAVSESLYAVYSSCDRVLKWYPRAVCGSTSRALGYTGLVCPSRLGDLASRYSESDISGLVGKVHDWEVWLRNEGIRARVRGFLTE
jgi:hypothetical protein